MTRSSYPDLDTYRREVFAQEDDLLRGIMPAAVEAGLPGISVSRGHNAPEEIIFLGKHRAIWKAEHEPHSVRAVSNKPAHGHIDRVVLGGFVVQHSRSDTGWPPNQHLHQCKSTLNTYRLIGVNFLFKSVCHFNNREQMNEVNASSAVKGLANRTGLLGFLFQRRSSLRAFGIATQPRHRSIDGIAIASPATA